MLAWPAVNIQTKRLRPAGALHELEAEVVTCNAESELSALFARARASGRRLTLIGGKRSFGEHFLPVEGGLGVDISALERGGSVRQTFPDGRILVRVGGGTRFEDLRAAFPGYRVRYVPTSDRITIAGALAACAHCSGSYFALAVAGFRLLTSSGEVVECTADAEGRARELFDVVPGSFGALGVTTFIDLILHPIDEKQLMGVHATYAAPQLSEGFYAALDAAKDDPRFDEGMGGVIYGNRGHTIVLADERLPLDFQPDPQRQAILCDDHLEDHAFAQGLANRFPRIAESTVKKQYPQGIVRWAHWYGFQFYQRGYDRAPEVLSRKGIKYGLARFLGVDARVPVAHQSWFFPRRLVRNVMSVYFSVLDEFPGIERRIEQQDIVLLGPCPFRAHSIGRTDQDVGVLTSSYSLASLAPPERQRVIGFFQKVSQVLYERIPETRISLCKQVHGDVSMLRDMHRDWIALVSGLKKEVDPHSLLTSRHLEMLLGR